MIPTVINSTDIESARYPTLGDFFFKDGIRHFVITNTGDDVMDDLIFIHEFIEEVLTRNAGIPEEEILKHDLWVEEEIKKGNWTSTLQGSKFISVFIYLFFLFFLIPFNSIYCSFFIPRNMNS